MWQPDRRDRYEPGQPGYEKERHEQLDLTELGGPVLQTPQNGGAVGKEEDRIEAIFAVHRRVHWDRARDHAGPKDDVAERDADHAEAEAEERGPKQGFHFRPAFAFQSGAEIDRPPHTARTRMAKFRRELDDLATKRTFFEANELKGSRSGAPSHSEDLLRELSSFYCSSRAPPRLLMSDRSSLQRVSSWFTPSMAVCRFRRKADGLSRRVPVLPSSRKVDSSGSTGASSSSREDRQRSCAASPV